MLLGQQFEDNRGGNDGTGTTISTTETTDPDDDHNLVVRGDDDQDDDSTTSNGGTNETGKNDSTNGNGSDDGKNSGDENGSKDEGKDDNGNGNSGDENGGKDNSNGNKDDASDEDDDSGKPSGGQNGKDDNENDAASDYAGVTEVRISDVNDATGIITITIDGKSVAVPVQTTVFNGRVTKSGVAQGKLFGYNIGVTVMLYYPQESGFSNNSVDVYMNRTEDSLTVLVDINGDGSKLLIKVNGMKALM